MINALWRAVAWLVSRGPVADWLIKRAMRTPYTHITAHNNPTDIYMARYWLFNAYDEVRHQSRWPWLPAVRIHNIVRPDSDRHMHDHPCDSRAIGLRGGYVELKRDPWFGHSVAGFKGQGSTGTLTLNEYHRIMQITGDCWTLFITWKYLGKWGFLVDGVKVPYEKYLGIEKVPTYRDMHPSITPLPTDYVPEDDVFDAASLLKD